MLTPYCVTFGAATTFDGCRAGNGRRRRIGSVEVSVPIVPTVAWNVAMPFLKVKVAGTVTLESEHETDAVPE